MFIYLYMFKVEPFNNNLKYFEYFDFEDDEDEEGGTTEIISTFNKDECKDNDSGGEDCEKINILKVDREEETNTEEIIDEDVNVVNVIKGNPGGIKISNNRNIEQKNENKTDQSSNIDNENKTEQNSSTNAAGGLSNQLLMIIILLFLLYLLIKN